MSDLAQILHAISEVRSGPDTTNVVPFPRRVIDLRDWFGAPTAEELLRIEENAHAARMLGLRQGAERAAAERLKVQRTLANIEAVRQRAGEIA